MKSETRREQSREGRKEATRLPHDLIDQRDLGLVDLGLTRLDVADLELGVLLSIFEGSANSHGRRRGNGERSASELDFAASPPSADLLNSPNQLPERLNHSRSSLELGMSDESLPLVLLPDDSVRVVLGEGDHPFEEEDLERKT